MQSATIETVMKSGEIKFLKPVIGFEASTSYIMEEFEAGSPFYWLSSVQDRQLRFIVVNVFDFFPAYAIEFNAEDLKTMGCPPAECLVFALLSVAGSAIDATVNLSAPIVINSSQKTGAQLVNRDAKYSLRQPLVKKG